jgi:hypothetical protein
MKLLRPLEIVDHKGAQDFSFGNYVLALQHFRKVGHDLFRLNAH